MGETTPLTASDGHKLACYTKSPSGKPRGGLVIVQEIFGVNRHMRGVADGYVANGYSVAMPALFDRVERGVELGYGDADIARGRELRGKITWEQVLADIAAGAANLKGVGKLGVVGYCWGGSVTWLSATRLKNFSAAICYYGGQVAMFADEKPNCAVMMHFGDKDQSIPMSDVEKVKAAQKGAAEIYVYPAGHGFNCEERGSHHAESAKLARERSLAFLRKHVG